MNKLRILWLLMLFPLVAGAALPVTPEVGLGMRYEPGVELQGQVSFRAIWHPEGRFRAFGGLSLGILDNAGPGSYGLGAAVRLIDPGQVGLSLAANHNDWSDWQVGENRVSALVSGQPLPSLHLAAGLAWRAPVFDTAQFRSPFAWRSPAPEWNYLYRIDWRVLTRDPVTLDVWLANIDQLTVHTAQQFPFGLYGTWNFGARDLLTLRLGSDIKGLSGLLFSLGELDVRIGVAHGL